MLRDLSFVIFLLNALLIFRLEVNAFQPTVFRRYLQTKNVDCSSLLLQPRNNLKLNAINSDWDTVIEDEQEKETFLRLSSTYLANKFQSCLGDDCVFLRSAAEAQLLLEEVLPPVTREELENEVKRVLAVIKERQGGEEDVSVEDFINGVISNPYWITAGPRVVQELIFLDSLYHFHHKKIQLLDDDDYDELKSILTWEGSAAASLKANEALFISAVAAYRRGRQVLNEQEYSALKSELQKQESWVVQRTPDPLEKMGLSTFIGYLHRSLKYSS